jgi:hypothetical protein
MARAAKPLLLAIASATMFAAVGSSAAAREGHVRRCFSSATATTGCTFCVTTRIGRIGATTMPTTITAATTMMTEA